jgi:hypothetical protein
LGDSTFAHFQLPTQTISHTLDWLYPQTEGTSVTPVTFRSNKGNDGPSAVEPQAYGAAREAAMAAFAQVWRSEDLAAG